VSVSSINHGSIADAMPSRDDCTCRSTMLLSVAPFHRKHARSSPKCSSFKAHN
jgi:hypothetical protein